MSRFQFWLMAAMAFLVLFYFVFKAFGSDALDQKLDRLKDNLTTVLILAGFISAAIAAFVMPRLAKLGSNVGGAGGAAGALLEELRQEREDIRQRALAAETAPKDFDVTTTIELNLNKLNEYYTLNLSQASRSFTLSIALIIAGFGLLCYGIYEVVAGDGGSTTVGVLSSISGIVLQFIGGTAFWLYGKSINQLNMFFGQLVRMQDTMLGIKLVDKIEEGGNRDRVTETIIVKLLDAQVKPSDYYVDQSYTVPGQSGGQSSGATPQSAASTASTTPAESSSSSNNAGIAAVTANPQSLDSTTPAAQA